jgi:uroporphyrin-III C-methyltransferase/precorrin-2 dehydrogenase/sirohydrochlorin ferrochelatase
MHIASRQPSEVLPARIAPLSVLPVFFDLRGKRAVVAGGSDAVAWKAELLAAAGAQIHVHAPSETLGAEMLRLLNGGDTRYVHHDDVWNPAAFDGAAIAVLGVETDGEAIAFYEEARRAGVPCNIVDKPAFCTFQFGSIVNRSPLVVGISTSGAAPILGQAVRRRIETLLPASLADWAALAARLRERVLKRVAGGAPRRALWEALVDRAFGPAPEGDDAAMLETLAAGRAKPAGGHVTFVGAGPGDAELLTLKAVRTLQAADVILFDDLVSDSVLELARREAKRILVGKRAGRPSCKQSEINELMVKLAKAGRHVVRLKSGDPMIFARTGEEIAELQKAGIGYETVPGITTGIALASACGVSLTHRGHAKSVRFVTGHSKNGGMPEDMDWNAIADPSTTTVFYMGARNAARIAERLIARGMAEDTPAVVATELGRTQQRVVRTDLTTLPQAVADLGLSGPMVIGIGHCFEQLQSDRQATSLSRQSRPEMIRAISG